MNRETTPGSNTGLFSPRIEQKAANKRKKKFTQNKNSHTKPRACNKNTLFRPKLMVRCAQPQACDGIVIVPQAARVSFN